ncbi:MAG: hypothetical protein ACFFDN_26590 [Candidatus Hodarchaeota archaeon]
MSKECLFQSRFPDINEARCTIPLTLQPKHLEKYCRTGWESWLCDYYHKENECPIIKEVMNILSHAFPLKLNRIETMEYMLHLKEQSGDHEGTYAKLKKYAHYQGWYDICVAATHSNWRHLWELYQKELKKEEK